MTDYEAASTVASVAVEALASDENAVVTLALDGDEVTSPLTLAAGENVLTISVVNGTAEKEYTVTLTYTPLSADLEDLKIGALTLTPAFDPNVTEYTTSTTNATNSITATPVDDGAIVSLILDETEVESPVTWATGENVLSIVVTNGDVEKVYTVTVTAS